MRAQFIRGEDPKETMDIGQYRTDAPKKDLFIKMHKEASKSDMFGMVTPIRDEGKEPSFKIRSKKIVNVTRSQKDYENDSFHNYTSREPQEFTIYLTQDEGIILFSDNTDEEYPDISLKEFLKITSCRPIKEGLDFERGKDPKQSMEVGLRSKYGKMYDLFVICHNLATNSENFPYVSEIVQDYENSDPYFNIESVFFYTDEEDNKIPEQFVITLYSDALLCYNAITKDEDDFRTEKKFIQLTNCWDEPDEGWERWRYES